jgi:hypothetical protein
MYNRNEAQRKNAPRERRSMEIEEGEIKDYGIVKRKGNSILR